MNFRHIDDVVVKAKFATEGGLTYRYRLEIMKVGASASPKTVCVVMQNPSDACEYKADKSVQFLEKLIFTCNYPEFVGIERIIIVNQFARVQTNGFSGLDSDIGRNNDAEIKSALDEAQIIIIAWGKTNRFNDRKQSIFELVKDIQGASLYKTLAHPSRGRYKNFIKRWEGSDY